MHLHHYYATPIYDRALGMHVTPGGDVYKKFEKREEKPTKRKEESSTDFTEVNFDDLGED